MYASILQTTVIAQLTFSSLSQFLPPSIFQQPPSMQSPMGAPLVMSPQMQMPYPQQRLPVMMMPYHSKAADKKYIKRKRRKQKYYTDSESSSSESCSSSNEYTRTQKRGHGKKKRQVLTPVISYVTRNGRVVYQKKIRKENAGEWLEIGGKKLMEDEKASGEMTIRDLKHKYGLKKHHHHNEE